MKVIKPGVLPENKVYRATCTHCKCEVEFTAAEATYAFSCRNEDILHVACPTCKKLIWVDK